MPTFLESTIFEPAKCIAMFAGLDKQILQTKELLRRIPASQRLMKHSRQFYTMSLNCKSKPNFELVRTTEGRYMIHQE